MSKTFTLGFNYIDQAKIIIPIEILRTLDMILRMGHPTCEVGLYIRGHWDNETFTYEMTDPNDFFLPEQIVSGAFVEVLQDAPDETYNGFIHRHPAGCTSFSSHDWENVNRNVLCSMVYIPGSGIVDNVLNIPVHGSPGSRLRMLKNKVEIQQPWDTELEALVRERVKVHEVEERVRNNVQTRGGQQGGKGRGIGPLPRPRGLPGAAVFDRTRTGQRQREEGGHRQPIEALFPTAGDDRDRMMPVLPGFGGAAGMRPVRRDVEMVGPAGTVQAGGTDEGGVSIAEIAAYAAQDGGRD